MVINHLLTGMILQVLTPIIVGPLRWFWTATIEQCVQDALIKPLFSKRNPWCPKNPGRLTAENPTNHPFIYKGTWSEPNLHEDMFHVNLQGCMMFWNTDQLPWDHVYVLCIYIYTWCFYIILIHLYTIILNIECYCRYVVWYRIAHRYSILYIQYWTYHYIYNVYVRIQYCMYNIMHYDIWCWIYNILYVNIIYCTHKTWFSFTFEMKWNLKKKQHRDPSEASLKAAGGEAEAATSRSRCVFRGIVDLAMLLASGVFPRYEWNKDLGIR